MKSTALPYIAAALFGASFAFCTIPAQAAMSASEAATTCKNEVKARYGDEARTKIHRIRSGRVSKVTLVVRGVGDDAFRVTCKINRDRQITELTDSRGQTIETASAGA